MNYINIAQRIFNTPILMEPGKFQIILNALGPRLGFDAPDVAAEIPGAANIRSAPWEPAKAKGVRVIEVNGSLVNRYATAPSGVMSYDRIADQLGQALADADVRGILLRLNSFGGEASGLWDLVDKVTAAAKQKKVWASVDDAACSACYAIASQAEKIFVTRTALYGSIGAIAVHYDISKLLEKAGVKPTVIFAGARKQDFLMDTPLPDQGRAWLQSSIDDLYSQFLDYVAAGRGIDPEDARKTEAALFRGSAGIDVGLADAVGTFEEALDELAGAIVQPVLVGPATAASTANPKGKEKTTMENPDSAVEKQPAAPPAINQAEIEAAAQMGERKRVSAILQSTEAAGREQLAQHLAFETNMAADQAIAMLAKAPKAAKPAGSEFAKAMAGVNNPDLGVAGSEASEEAAAIQRMVAYGKLAIGATN